jgi:hypothetical protein
MPFSHPTIQKHTHAHAHAHMRIRLLSSKARLGTTHPLSREQPYASCHRHGCAPQRMRATHRGRHAVAMCVPTLVCTTSTHKKVHSRPFITHTHHTQITLLSPRATHSASHGSARAVDWRRTSLWPQAHLSSCLAHAALAPFAVGWFDKLRCLDNVNNSDSLTLINRLITPLITVHHTDKWPTDQHSHRMIGWP